VRNLILLCNLLLISSAAYSEEDAKTNTIEYLPLSPNFVVNLQGGHRSYLRADVQLMIDGSDNVEKIKAHLPVIRHSLILLFSDYAADQLSTSSQREDLRKKALEQTQATLDKYASNSSLEDIFFTEFLVQ